MRKTGVQYALCILWITSFSPPFRLEWGYNKSRLCSVKLHRRLCYMMYEKSVYAPTVHLCGRKSPPIETRFFYKLHRKRNTAIPSLDTAVWLHIFCLAHRNPAATTTVFFFCRDVAGILLYYFVGYIVNVTNLIVHDLFNHTI